MSHMQTCFKLGQIKEGGCFFTIKAHQKTEFCDFKINSRYIPNILLRLLSIEKPFCLVSLIPSLGNEMFLSFLNFEDVNEARILLQNIINKFNDFKFCYELEFIGENFIGIDSSTIRNAYDNYALRYLEKLGYVIISQKITKYLIQTKENSCYCLKNPILRTNFIEEYSNFSFISNDIHKKTNHVCFHVEGDVIFLKCEHLLKTISKKQYNHLQNNEFTKLEFIPCCVLPNCDIGYAVQIEKIKDSKKYEKYWKFVHGIDISPTNYLIWVTFNYGDEDNIWIYPEQCVLYFNPFNFKKISEEKAKTFFTELQSSIKLSFQSLS